jgi:hypothetical protein
VEAVAVAEVTALGLLVLLVLAAVVMVEQVILAQQPWVGMQL